MPRRKPRSAISDEARALALEKARQEEEKAAEKRKEIERPEGFQVAGGIKSKDRVQELAEVFTAEREVKAMLDLLGDTAYSMTARFLEPACGNGNFLEEILSRKLSGLAAASHGQDDFEFRIIFALSSVYGIDISQENIDQARARMKALIVHSYSTGQNTWVPEDGFYDSVDYVLETNIVLGDSLNHAEKVIFVEYTSPSPMLFSQRFFTLNEIERGRRTPGDSPKPFKIVGARHYLDLNGSPN